MFARMILENVIAQHKGETARWMSERSGEHEHQAGGAGTCAMGMRRGLSLAELLDAYGAGRVTRLGAMRWLACRRYADFLVVLDFNDRRLPRGRLPLRPLRQQIMRARRKRRHS